MYYTFSKCNSTVQYTKVNSINSTQLTIIYCFHIQGWKHLSSRKTEKGDLLFQTGGGGKTFNVFNLKDEPNKIPNMLK